MHALVVYESMYGNTKAIAEAIARGLASAAQVDLVEVGSAPSTVDADVLVVG
ncbi:flavodoxin domain-containing protein, partial [Thermocrispum sp.]